MTASFVGGDAQGANSTSVTVTMPGGIQSGDIALIAHPYSPTVTGGTDPTTPSGWTQLDTEDWSASYRARLYGKVLTGSETTVSFSNGSQKLTAALGVFRGVSAIHVNGFRLATTVATTHTAASATATVNVVQVAFITERESAPSTAFTPPAGHTMGPAVYLTGGGATCAGLAYNLTTTTGTIGGGTWGEDVANDALVMFVVGLAVPLEATGDRTATASGTGAAAVTRSATGNRTASASITGAGGIALGAAGNLAASTSLTGDALVSVTTIAPEPYVPRSPFLIEVWDGTVSPFVRVGRVGSYVASEVVLRHNKVGSWKFTMTLSDGGVDLLSPVGRRITIDYRGSRILSGPVYGIRRSRSGVEDQVEVYGYSDLVWLDRRLGFPSPLATFPADGTAFTQAAYRDIPGSSAPAETLVKYWVTRNCVTRLPIPTLSVAPDLARGPTKLYGPRFETVLETCAHVADNSGIGISNQQVGAGLVFDIYEPQVQPVRLSRSLGNLRDWEFVNEGPNATRVVIGGSGENTARQFTLGRLAPSEVGWGITEAFIESSGETQAEVVQDGVDFLYQNIPTASFSVTPQETESMRFGETYGLGDTVDTELFPGLTLTDIVREVTITDSVDEGVDVKPVVGNIEAARKYDAVYMELRRLRLQITKRERET